MGRRSFLPVAIKYRHLHLDWQIPLLAEQGFQRIIYLVLTSNQTALAGEDDLVLASGMEYAHIAVDFSRPTLENFQLVAALL